MVVIIEGVIQDVICVCVCVGVTGIPIVVPPSTLHMDGDRLWLVVVVVVVAALINQLPAAGSEPVADTNKWQKWGGGGFLANTIGVRVSSRG